MILSAFVAMAICKQFLDVLTPLNLGSVVKLSSVIILLSLQPLCLLGDKLRLQIEKQIDKWSLCLPTRCSLSAIIKPCLPNNLLIFVSTNLTSSFFPFKNYSYFRSFTRILYHQANHLITYLNLVLSLLQSTFQICFSSVSVTFL
jgi:hypothetical protein